MYPGNAPAVLFLGQSYLRAENPEDPFLSAVVRRFQGTPDPAKGYSSLFSCNWQGAPQQALSWMDELRHRITRPQSLEIVAKYIWNAVFSSAIDSMWEEAFRDPKWRDTAQAFDRDTMHGDPRNRTRLHCTYLYGCVNRHDTASKPPLTKGEWVTRRETATLLGSRIPDTVTPLGYLLVDGYESAADWFQPTDLYAIAQRLPKKRAHLFGVTETASLDEYIKELIESERLVAHGCTLAQFFAAAATEGILSLTRTVGISSKSRVISFARDGAEQQQDEVPRDVHNAVSRSARVLDETILGYPTPMSQDRRYQEFRTFLGSSDGRPYWPAYGRKMWFERKFAKELISAAKKALEARNPPDWPILLHGRSGTGKSVAMAALAYEVRSEGRYPVLYIERKPMSPVLPDIDSFCHWCEDLGARSTLIVWDGMADIKRYSDMVGYLRGRGRRVVVVGSCYTLKDKKGAKQPRAAVVRAPDEFTAEEYEDFRKYLLEYVPPEDLPRSLAEIDRTFLVALYRNLPATRVPIGRGVNLAMRDDEEKLKELASTHRPVEARQSSLAAALSRSGYDISQKVLQEGQIEVEGDRVTAIERLTGLIMVPGQFGLRVPLELIVRAMGSTNYDDFSDILNNSDMFDWYSDETGQIFIGPRHAEEARLVVEHRLPTPTSQVHFAEMLIGALRPSALAEGSAEMEFAIQLLKVMGSTSQYKERYVRSFNVLASALKNLREEKGVESPRLMLQEGNLLKESAIFRIGKGESGESVAHLFAEAEEVLRKGLEVAGQSRGLSELKSMLNVELAAILRSRARQSARKPAEVLELLRDLRYCLHQARALDPSNYYPVRVLFDSVRSSLELKGVPDGDRAAAIGDMLYTFQSARVELFTFEQKIECGALHGDFLRLLKRTQDLEALTARMIQQHSPAGYYLKAYTMGRWDEHKQRGNEGPLLEAMEEAEKFLMAHSELTYRDIRCLDLLLDIWWYRRQGYTAFEEERQTCRFSKEEWETLGELLSLALSTEQSHRQLEHRFLHSISEFHLGAYNRAFEALKGISRMSDEMHSRSRNKTWFLASNFDGTATGYHGTVEQAATEGGRGVVYVNSLNQRVPFFASQFENQRIRVKESLPEFHIGFRFNGPVATPAPVKTQRRQGQGAQSELA